MKVYLPVAISVLLYSCSSSKLNKTIQEGEVTRIEKTLSSDDMEGRASFTPGIEKAAAFIAAEMKKTGLQPLPKEQDYLQKFSMLQATITEARGRINDVGISQDDIACISTNSTISIDTKSGYKLVQIKAGENFMQGFRPYISSKENILIIADTSHRSTFNNIQRFLNSARFPQNNNVVLLLANNFNPANYAIQIKQAITTQALANVGGMLPGKSKPNEYVVFSGHYDHLGYGKPDSKGDSLYNGANDDASGVTAMLMLAKYYKKLNNNERSILFVAFTSEEIGGFGARYFSNQLNADSVMAMFNIEMIGTESKWGTNSAYITGFEKTDFGKILDTNASKIGFHFYPDPYTKEQLFYRSDNATLARLGVPAHTISTSKMDNEPHYHKPSDAIETLDMKNMTSVIKAIAVSASTIISGADTPTRVDTKQLR